MTKFVAPTGMTNSNNGSVSSNNQNNNTGRVSGDGSCFFHAILGSLKYTMTFDNATQFIQNLLLAHGRDLHIHIMKKTYEEYKHDTSFPLKREIESPAQYKTMIAAVQKASYNPIMDTNLWATDSEISVTSNYMGRDIYIREEFQQGQVIHISPTSNRTGSPLYVIYRGTDGAAQGCHYDVDVKATRQAAVVWRNYLSLATAVVHGLPYAGGSRVTVSEPHQLLDAIMIKVHEMKENNAQKEIGMGDIIEATESIVGRHLGIYEKTEPYMVRRKERMTLQSPIIIKRIPQPKGVVQYQLDIDKTQHWSLYGALASIAPSNMRNPYVLYRKVFKSARQDAVPIPWSGPHQEEIDTLANIVGKNLFIVKVNKGGTKSIHFKSKGIQERGTVNLTLTYHYEIHGKQQRSYINKPVPLKTGATAAHKTSPFRQTVNVRHAADIKDQAETLKTVLNKTNITKTNRAPNQSTTQSTTQNNTQSNTTVSENVSEELESVVNNIEKAAEHAYTPKEQRLVDVDMDAVVAKVVEYFKQHDPKALQQLIQTSQSSPGLWKKVRKHLGGAVVGAGKRVDRVVQQSTVGDWGILGLAVSVGIPVVSSYLSFWRAFTGV
jgi:hypothetical protein